MKEFLSKKFGGLPVWAWALIGVAGVGAGYLLIRWQQSKSSTPSSLTTSNTPDLTTGNASGQESNSATGTVGSNGVIDNPYPETTVNGQQVPIIPPGYQGVYDSNGNLVGWEPIPTNPTPTTPSNPTTPTQTPPPTTSNPKPVPTPPVAHPLTKVTMTGALATIYGGVHNGGRDLLTLHPGQQVDVTGSKVSWGSDTYYPVTFNGTSGWVRAATIGGGPSTVGTLQPLMTTLSPARRA